MTATDQSPLGLRAADVCARARRLAEPALRAAVGTLPDSIRLVAGYHFGWSDRHGAPARSAGGKAVRPALVLLSAEAVGGTTRTALPAAVAVELVHAFSLLHDDVMDGDPTRRHRPTAWSVYGVGTAILAGDALLALAFDTLAAGDPAPGGRAPDAWALADRGPDDRTAADRRPERSGPDPTAAGRGAQNRGAQNRGGSDRGAEGSGGAGGAVGRLSTTVQRLIDGQYADMAFENRADIGLPECLRMAEGKTGALFACACALGASAGGGTPDQVGALHAFGERLGVAFQLVDDLLGIWGDPRVTGKPVHSDLRRRKKSLPVVAALASGTAAGHEFAALYGQEPPLSDDTAVRAARLIEAAGARGWCRAAIGGELERALHTLRGAVGERAAGDLAALAHLLADRDH